MPSSSPSSGTATTGAKNLQERLHQLLTRLSTTIELIKNWPESEGDDASIHVETTTKLINAIHEVVEGLKNVEGVVKADNDLKKSLKDCQIPVNLLDLLDHGNGLNPDCFSRGLLREALGQLAGLKRRKTALEMLGAVVQKGLNKRIPEIKKSNKRQHESNDNVGESEGASEAPVSKKARTDAELTS